MSNLLGEFPTYAELGQELVENAHDQTESLDLVELVVMLEERGGANIPESAIGDLSATETRMFVIRETLAGGEDVETTLFGMPVVIKAVPKTEIGGEPEGPDLSGDREPRNPLPSEDSDSQELEQSKV